MTDRKKCMRRHIAIVEKLNNHKQADYLRSLSNSCKLEIVALDLPSIHMLKKSGFTYKTIDYYRPYKESMDSLERCVRFAREWYRDPPSSITYKQINLAAVMEIPLLMLLLRFDEILCVLQYILGSGNGKIDFYLMVSPEVRKRAEAILEGIAADREIRVFYKKAFLNKNFELYAKQRLSFITSVFLRARWSFGKKKDIRPSILFYECLDKIGSIPAHLSNIVKCIALYPSFSIKIFRRCKKIGLSYCLMKMPGINCLIKAHFIEKRGLKPALRSSLRKLFPVDDKGLKRISLFISREISMKIPFYISCIEDADKWINKVNLVVTSNDTTPIAKLITLIASKHNIPTLVLQHGVTSGGKVAQINGSKFFGIGFLPLISSKMAVGGNMSMKWFAENEVSMERLVVTGLPQMDKYLYHKHDPAAAKERICKKFGMDRNKALILFATQHSNDKNRLSGYHLTPLETYVLLEETGKALASVKDMNIIIKMHPNSEDAEKLYTDIINSCGVKDFAVTKFHDISEILMASDLVITPWSTVGLEAFLLGKELITINFSGTPDRMPYAEKGAAKGAYSSNELKELLISFQRTGRLGIDRYSIDMFNKEYNDTGSKTASERCAELILEMAGNNK